MTLNLKPDIDTVLNIRQRLAETLAKVELPTLARLDVDAELSRLENLAVELRLAEEEVNLGQ